MQRRALKATHHCNDDSPDDSIANDSKAKTGIANPWFGERSLSYGWWYEHRNQHLCENWWRLVFLKGFLGGFQICHTWIFQVCKICAFSPKKPTKRQKFYISGRSRYLSPLKLGKWSNFDGSHMFQMGGEKPPTVGYVDANSWWKTRYTLGWWT